jgi:DNA-binding transcriptional LysR family regulator
VEPTIYGQALLSRSLAIFDELRQSVSDIDTLGDPTTGEIRLACPLAIASTLMPPALESFVAKYPRAILHFDEVSAGAMARSFQELRERQYDLILDRWSPVIVNRPRDDEISTKFLFNDPLVSSRAKTADGQVVVVKSICAICLQNLGLCRELTLGTTERWRKLVMPAGFLCPKPAWSLYPSRLSLTSLPMDRSLPLCQGRWLISNH